MPAKVLDGDTATRLGGGWGAASELYWIKVTEDFVVRTSIRWVTGLTKVRGVMATTRWKRSGVCKRSGASAGIDRGYWPAPGISPLIPHGRKVRWRFRATSSFELKRFTRAIVTTIPWFLFCTYGQLRIGIEQVRRYHRIKVVLSRVDRAGMGNSHVKGGALFESDKKYFCPGRTGTNAYIVWCNVTGLLLEWGYWFTSRETAGGCSGRWDGQWWHSDAFVSWRMVSCYALYERLSFIDHPAHPHFFWRTRKWYYLNEVASKQLCIPICADAGDEGWRR